MGRKETRVTPWPDAVGGRSSGLRRWCTVLFVLVSFLPREAQAVPFFGGPDGKIGTAMVVLGAAAGALVAPVGAMVTTLRGEPTKEWGRSSLVFGGIASVAGGVSLAVGATRDEPEFYALGGVALGLGLNGLFWGAASEVTLPQEDPGIVTGPRPTMAQAPVMVVLRGSF